MPNEEWEVHKFRNRKTEYPVMKFMFSLLIYQNLHQNNHVCFISFTNISFNGKESDTSLAWQLGTSQQLLLSTQQWRLYCFCMPSIRIFPFGWPHFSLNWNVTMRRNLYITHDKKKDSFLKCHHGRSKIDIRTANRRTTEEDKKEPQFSSSQLYGKLSLHIKHRIAVIGILQSKFYVHNQWKNIKEKTKQ